MNSNVDDLNLRIERLEAELSAAVTALQRRRRGFDRRRVAYGAIVGLVAGVALSSWTLGAQAPTEIPSTPEAQYLSLVRRVTALEQKSSSKVKGPFEVVDNDGKAMFRVGGAEGRGFALLAANGDVVAVGSVVENGAIFRAQAPDKSSSVSMGVAGKAFTGVVAREGMDKPRATMGFAGGVGFVDVSTGAGKVAVHLGASSAGNGQFQIADSGGTALVQAGILAGGVGVVQTFPNGNPAAGMVGLAGTFIVGRNGGK